MWGCWATGLDAGPRTRGSVELTSANPTVISRRTSVNPAPICPRTSVDPVVNLPAGVGDLPGRVGEFLIDRWHEFVERVEVGALLPELPASFPG